MSLWNLNWPSGPNNTRLLEGQAIGRNVSDGFCINTDDNRPTPPTFVLQKL